MPIDQIISWVSYGASALGIIIGVIIAILEKISGKKKLTEADKYAKSVVEAIEKVEAMYPAEKSGATKKTIATLFINQAVNSLKKYKPTDEQISKDIDEAVAITRKVNFREGSSSGGTATTTASVQPAIFSASGTTSNSTNLIA